MKRKALPERAARSRQRRVALLIDFSRGYGRRILLGVAKFAREHHEWSVESEEWRWTDAMPGWIRKWDGDGIIAWVETRKQAAVIQKLRTPAVDVRGAAAGCTLPLVDTENRTVANLAADHFRQRGFRHYAFCGFVGANYSDARSRFFQERLARSGCACALYEPPDMPRDTQTIELEKRGLLYQNHLARWLQSLPKPVGLMACNDIRGQQVMNACRRRGLLVPEEVAVIGADNDEIFCELSDPPLSSVALDTVRIGYEAAALLERLMAGGRPPDRPVLIPPMGIVTRRSTDVLATDDRRLAAGTRYLRQHIFDPVRIHSAARAAGMSRRVFERRFTALVGRPPKAEVLRLRLERVKTLLTDTDWPLAQIAEKTGFKYSQHLHELFTRKTGSTPGAYRTRASLDHARAIRAKSRRDQP